MLKKTILSFLLVIMGAASYGTTYYVSSSLGKNSNQGTSKARPWKSLKKVNRRTFKAGDSILFRRGDVWRGQLIPSSSGNQSEFIYYGAYGVGEKPLLLGSVARIDSNDWKEKENNIWKTRIKRSKDIGNVILNSRADLAKKKPMLDSLENNNDFFSPKNRLYYKSNTNPARKYSSIELAIKKHIVLVIEKDYLIFENIAIKYGGANGISCTSTSFINIKKCEISFIGGGFLVKNARYGNGIEFWENADNCLVEDCVVDQIFDTGLTNQARGENAIQKNIIYRNNIISNCGLASFEYFSSGESAYTDNIIFEDNISKDAGFGWAPKRQYGYGRNHLLFHRNNATTDNIFIINNDFFKSKGSAIAFYSNGVWSGFENVQLNNNNYHDTNKEGYLFRFFTDGIGWENYKYSEKDRYIATMKKDKASKFK